MDFARINTRRDAEKGATYHVDYEGERLFHEGRPITISLLGLESNEGKRATAKMVKELDRKAPTNRKGQKKTPSVDELLDAMDGREKAQAELYATLCTGWENIYYIDDDKIDDENAVPYELPFSKENAVKLFSTRPWVMEGIDGFLADRKNFMTSLSED